MLTLPLVLTDKIWVCYIVGSSAQSKAVGNKTANNGSWHTAGSSVAGDLRVVCTGGLGRAPGDTLRVAGPSFFFLLSHPVPP